MDLETALDFAALTNNECDETEHRFWYKAITEMVPQNVEFYMEKPSGWCCCAAGAVIEVGCAAGGGSTTLAAACDEREFDLHCVDSWFTCGAGYRLGIDGCAQLAAHIDQLRRPWRSELVIRHVGDSKKIGQRLNVPCVFLWIDAEHGHPHPALDFRAFQDLVVPGGIVAFHDAPYHGLPESLQVLEKDGDFEGWEELKDLPPADCIVPDEKKRFSISVGFCTRAWRRL